MSRNKNARKVSYFVKRDRNTGSYYVFVDGYKHPILIQKKPAGWYACSQYHKTLRDAIIYAAYGV